MSRRHKGQIFLAHAPAISYIDEEIEHFYEEVDSMHRKGKRYTKLM